jgi:hypothetical protein
VLSLRDGLETMFGAHSPRNERELDRASRAEIAAPNHAKPVLPAMASPIKQEIGHSGACSAPDVHLMRTARHQAGRASVGGDGGIRTPVQNRWPVASYVRSRHFVCHRGLLPTGSRCGEPNCLR